MMILRRIKLNRKRSYSIPNKIELLAVFVLEIRDVFLNFRSNFYSISASINVHRTHTKRDTSYSTYYFIEYSGNILGPIGFVGISSNLSFVYDLNNDDDDDDDDCILIRTLRNK